MNFVKAGAALLIRDRRMGLHLFFVLTDPDSKNHLVVTAAVVTERSHTDKTCRLNVGDHPFIRHASNVDYGSATFVPLGRIEEWLKSGQATFQGNLSPALLKLIQQGLLSSSRTIHAIVDHCRPLFDT